MYDDDVLSPVVRTSVSSYRPARFPTRNIVTPIVLLYGDCDSLVHIETMLAQLPDHTVAKALHTYEHLDVLWGKNVHKDVIPEVVQALKYYQCNQVRDDAVVDSKPPMTEVVSDME